MRRRRGLYSRRGRPDKLKKGDGELTIRLKRTHDIAAELGAHKAGRILVGFALETDHEEANAEGKLQRKNFDFIVLNSLRDAGAGFGVDTNKVTLIDRAGREELPLLSKAETAEKIADKNRIHSEIAMLRRLKVENYALIDRLELELDDRLNIITGETGAGKSILLGALGLLLGNKNDNATLKDDKRNWPDRRRFRSRNKGPAGILRPKRPGLQPRNDTHAPDHPGRQEPLVHQRHSRSPCVAALNWDRN